MFLRIKKRELQIRRFWTRTRLLALLATIVCCTTSQAQWQPRGMTVAPAQPAFVTPPPAYAPPPVATAQYYAPGNPYAGQYAPQYAPAPVPGMPPPPGLATAGFAPASLSGNTIQLAQATTPGQPVIVGPPIAQGFGTNVPAYGPPPVYTAPAPAFGDVFSAPAWGEATFAPSQYVKFLQNIRLRHTFVDGGNDPDEFGINDTEIAATFAYPDFLGSQQPLLISPGFILNLWDPPTLDPLLSDGTIPSRAYSAYLDFYWTPRLNERLSAELDFRIGVYSDFKSIDSDAIRPQAYAAGIYQLSPTLAFKGGATYINRVDIDLLPVVGLVWTPDPYTYFDITFPNPKLSHYAWRWGNTDVWWYIAGEYGGGSWAVRDISAEGLANGGQRMDINDLRAIAGLEWTGGYISAKTFIEVGYVFERELVFEAAPAANINLEDTIMVRGGISF